MLQDIQSSLGILLSESNKQQQDVGLEITTCENNGEQLFFDLSIPSVSALDAYATGCPPASGQLPGHVGTRCIAGSLRPGGCGAQDWHACTYQFQCVKCVLLGLVQHPHYLFLHEVWQRLSEVREAREEFTQVLESFQGVGMKIAFHDTQCTAV